MKSMRSKLTIRWDYRSSAPQKLLQLALDGYFQAYRNLVGPVPTLW